MAACQWFGRGDGDGIDVFHVEDLAVVLHGLDRRPSRTWRACAVGVADGHDLDAGDGLEGTEMAAAPAAHADDGDADLVVGAGGVEGRGRPGRRLRRRQGL